MSDINIQQAQAISQGGLTAPVKVYIAIAKTK